MQKFIITILHQGKKSPINVKAKDKDSAVALVYKTTNAQQVVHIETKEEYKKRNKVFGAVMKSNFINTRSSKRDRRD